MKKIEAIFQPFKLDEIKEALENEKIPRVTIFEVKGAGSQQGSIKYYRGAEYIEDSLEIKIEIIVDDDEAKRLTGIIVAFSASVISVTAKLLFYPHRGVAPCARRPTQAILDRIGRVSIGPTYLMRNRSL